MVTRIMMKKAMDRDSVSKEPVVESIGSYLGDAIRHFIGDDIKIISVEVRDKSTFIVTFKESSSEYEEAQTREIAAISVLNMLSKDIRDKEYGKSKKELDYTMERIQKLSDAMTSQQMTGPATGYGLKPVYGSNSGGGGSPYSAGGYTMKPRPPTPNLDQLIENVKRRELEREKGKYKPWDSLIRKIYKK